MKKVTVNGIELAYGRHGTGRPLMLVHGYPLEHSIWKDVVHLLENDFDLILPDLRGFGQSQVVESVYRMEDMAADLARLLDQLGIENTAIAGHSMGGYVALAFACAYPRRVTGLGLVASQALADTPERKQGRYDAAEEIFHNGVEQVAEAMPAKLTPDERVQAYVREVIAAQQPAGLAGALKAMAERADSTSALSSFDFPIVVVHGEEDELIPVERAHEIIAVTPHAALAVFPKVGHMPMMENPAGTATALKHLLG